MATVSIHEAKTHLSKLIKRAEAGEEIVIARGKEPVVTLKLVSPQKRPMSEFYGKYPELASIPDSAWDPLTAEEHEKYFENAFIDPKIYPDKD